MSTIPFFRFAVGDAADFDVGVIWTGEAFGGAEMTLTVYQQPADGGAALMTADTASGRIQVRSDGQGFDYMIPQDVHAALPLGLLKVQQVMVLNGISRILFNGTWSRVPGAATGTGQTLTYDGYKDPIEFYDANPVIALRTTGAPGASAYEQWLDAGNAGTEDQFLAALVGAQGLQGAPGAQGEQGAQGIQGVPGQGVPAGGTTGQAAVKASDADYDVEWKTLAAADLSNVDFSTLPAAYDETSAGAAGVTKGRLYLNGSVLQVKLT